MPPVSWRRRSGCAARTAVMQNPERRTCQPAAQELPDAVRRGAGTGSIIRWRFYKKPGRWRSARFQGRPLARLTSCNACLARFRLTR